MLQFDFFKGERENRRVPTNYSLEQRNAAQSTLERIIMGESPRSPLLRSAGAIKSRLLLFMDEGKTTKEMIAETNSTVGSTERGKEFARQLEDVVKRLSLP